MRSYWSGCSIIRTRSCEEAADRIDALNVEIARQLRELETYTRRARRFTRCYSCSLPLGYERRKAESRNAESVERKD